MCVSVPVCMCEDDSEAECHKPESIVKPIYHQSVAHILYPPHSALRHINSIFRCWLTLPPRPRGMRWAWPHVCILRTSLQILVVLHGSKFVRCWGMFKMDRYYIVCVCVYKPQQHNIRGSGDREMTLFFPVQMSISRRPRLRVLFKGAGDQLCVMCC